MKLSHRRLELRPVIFVLLLVWVALIVPASTVMAQPENPAVDTEGAIELKGVVVVPSRWAVLMLVAFAFLLSIVVALLAQRHEERRETRELRQRLAELQQTVRQRELRDRELAEPRAAVDSNGRSPETPSEKGQTP